LSRGSRNSTPVWEERVSFDVKTRATVRPSSSDLWFLAYLPLAISDGIATPLIPLLALQHFGATAFAVTIIIAASGMSQVPFTILWGNLSDRVAHRKYFLVGSFLATGVSLILIALATNLLTFFWLNVVEGLASAASAPIGTMLLLETRHKRWWPTDIGLFGLISGLGTTAGLAIGFLWLFVIGYSQPAIQAMTALLLVSGALALVSAGVAWAWIEEPAARVERRTVSGLLNLNRGAVERFRHVRARISGLVDLTRSTAERLPGREYLFLAALGVMSVGFDIFWGPVYVLLGLGTPALLVWLTLLNALLGVTWAFISTASTLFLVRLVGRSARGRALGLYNAIAGAGSLIGTLPGGWLYATYGVHFAYSVAALTVVLGAALLLPIPYHMFQFSHAITHRRHIGRNARAVARPLRRKG